MKLSGGDWMQQIETNIFWLSNDGGLWSSKAGLNLVAVDWVKQAGGIWANLSGSWGWFIDQSPLVMAEQSRVAAGSSGYSIEDWWELRELGFKLAVVDRVKLAGGDDGA